MGSVSIVNRDEDLTFNDGQHCHIALHSTHTYTCFLVIMLQSPWIAIDQKGLYKGVRAGINVIPSNDYRIMQIL